MTRIACINESYIRDAQVFTGSSADFDKDSFELEDMYVDYNAMSFVGIFEGDCKDEIIRRAADKVGVHADAIELIDILPLH